MRIDIDIRGTVVRAQTPRLTLAADDGSLLEASTNNKLGNIMLKCCRLRPLKFALLSLIFAAWLSVSAELVDDGAACKSEGLCSVHGNTPLAVFHKHPALISLLDLPNRQPAGR